MMYGLDDKDDSIEDVAYRIRLAVSEHCAGDCREVASSLERCAEEAVSALWANPIKIYIPLLAYRRVQDCIRQGYCPSQQEMRGS